MRRLVNQVVRACRATSILATSREPLRINGETVTPVAPLHVPDASANADADAVATCESVDLFVDRTRLAAPGFALTDRNADAVAELCRRLDGLPLAIELAAARVGVLTPEDILDRLQSRFGLLAGGSRTGPERHRSLQSALDWSHDLLSSSERLLFRRLSVFAGTLSLEAIEQVCCDAQLSTAAVVGVLSNLVEKSLVTAGTAESTRRRFRMLDTLQQYARERLEQSGELDLLLSYHSDFFLALAEEASPHLRSHERKRWREVLATDISNMRAALAWSRESDLQKHLRMTIALTDFWYINGLVQEGDGWFETALRAYRVRDGLRARTLDYGSSIAYWRADLERYASRCHEFLDIYRELGDQEGIRHALWRVGEVEEWGGRPDLAKRYFEDALAAAKGAGNIGTVVVCLQNLGRIAMRARDHALARKYLQQSLEWNEQYGDLFQKNWALMYLGLNAVDCGDASGARAFLQQAMRIGIESDWKVGVATPLMYFATLAAVEGDPIRAMRLAGASQALAESAGAAPIRLTRPMVDRWLDPVRSELGPELSEACTAEGRAMSWQAAIDYALGT